MSALTRLEATLDSVASDLSALLASVPLHRNNTDAGMFVIVGMPEFRWGELSAEQKHEQMRLLRRYSPASEVLSVWLQGAPKNLVAQFQTAHKCMLMWLELSSNFSISLNRESNRLRLIEAASEFHKILEVLAHGGRDQTLLIPDTNALLGHPDPTAYRKLTTAQEFEFLLLPTVLAELDELKILHRNPDVREKAEKLITRIKGWRKQGPLLDGITVDKTIRVRAAHQEPSVSKSLSWLDAENKDDRIIASSLEVQSRQPSTRLIVVTGDINLQNKCDAAFIETAEL